MNRQDYDNAMAARDTARDYLAALHNAREGCLTDDVLSRYEQMREALSPIYEASNAAFDETFGGGFFDDETIENEFY